MKRKVLITGTKSSLIDSETRGLLQRVFELNYCDTNGDTIKKRMLKFMPHVVIFCIGNEMFLNLSLLPLIRNNSAIKNLPIIIVGEKRDCMELTRTLPTTDVYATIFAPIPAEHLKTTIIDATNYLPSEYSISNRNSLESNNNFIKKKILVVDDDIKMLKIINMYLQDTYEVAIAKNGRTALKYLEKNIPDLILLDYMMPEEDGPTVLSNIRNNPLNFAVPVFFLTGVSEREAVKKVLNLNVQGYLLKPVAKDDLLSRLSDFFSIA